MSIWSPQFVANPSPSSLSYLLIYRSLPCLSPKLLVTNFSRPPNPQDVPQALIDEHLQLLLQILVSLHVSEPYKSTAFTFELKTLSLVLVVSAVGRHIGLSIANVCLAFPIRAIMSSSVPPFLLTILPRYVNSSTSSIRPPTTDTPSSRLVPIRINFVLVALIFRPTFASCTSKARVLSLISCILCDSRAKSSAKSRSSKDVVKVH